MRHAVLPLLLIACLLITARPTASFEIEAERIYESGQGQATLRVISTADLEVFAPLIEAFQVRNPAIDVHYTVASSSELMKAIHDEGAAFDIAISSAMDLQTKLVNDGFARTYRSGETAALPDWARWRDQLFAFTQEPAVLIYSRQALDGLPVPSTRADLIALLRDHPERFSGRIGTYDIEESGLGYLFATQDARNSESFWRLAEVMGRLDARLFCCSAEMISGVESGRLALAYNVLGSYARSRLAGTGDVGIVMLQDFANVMLRTALVPTTATAIDEAGTFIDFLVSSGTRPIIAELTGLPPIDPDALTAEAASRPIRLGPGLLVYLDQMKRRTFIRAWNSALIQP